jgi:transcriptional regulator with XRE-family HTH domain
MSDIRNTWEYRYVSKVGDIAIRISNRLREIGLTKADLADRLGVSRPTVTQMLNGDNNFTIKTLAKLSVALDLSIEQIVGYERPMIDSIVAIPYHISSLSTPTFSAKHEASGGFYGAKNNGRLDSTYYRKECA